MTDAVTAGHRVHGRTKISARAVGRVVSAVTADALGVSASDVRVELADDSGDIAVIAKTPIGVTPLGETPRMPGSLLDRLGAAQATIRDRCLELTGSSIGRVDLRITGADLRARGRVS